MNTGNTTANTSSENGLSPTLRGVIDPLRRCPLDCRFCYYRHTDQATVRPWEDVLADVEAAERRGCTAVDITGGEPLVYPELVQLCETLLARNITPRIISSFIGSGLTFDTLQPLPVQWLISMHGLAVTHDALVGLAGGRARQLERLGLIGEGVDVNYVMVRPNEADILQWAQAITARRPRIVNFINFNPHYQWRDAAETQELVVSAAVKHQLAAAIDVLEEAGTGCNVRYFPMCWLLDRLRRCVCNDLHVGFDSGEWNNDIVPLTTDGAIQYGRRLSSRNEEKGEPCNQCDLQNICGGANRYWHRASRERDGEQLTPVVDYDGPQHFYAYRRNNAAGMP